MNTSKSSFKNYSILICASVMVLALSSCFHLIKKVEPSENIVSKEYDMEGFTGITASKKIILYFSEGEQYSVKAEGPENMMAELKCKVEADNTLNLEVNQGERFAADVDSKKVKVWVTAPGVNHFSTLVDAVIKSEPLKNMDYLSIENFNGSWFLCDSIQTDNISIATHNGSNVVIVFCQSSILTASAFNAGSIKVGGEIENLMTLEAHNGSSIAFSGKAQTVNAQAFNGSEIELDGEFQTKRVEEHNGASISIGNKHFYFNGSEK